MSRTTVVVGLIDRYANLSRPILHPEKIAELIRRSAEVGESQRARPRAFQLDRRLGKMLVASLIARYEAGEPIPRLAAEVGVSKSGMNDLLRRHGVALRFRRMTNDEVARAVARYEKGAPLSLLATEFDASQETIRKTLIGAGVTMRQARRV